MFGNVMWAVRLPALLLNAGTCLITFHCTKKLFGSEKLALGAALLGQLMPLVIAGGYLMTIDAPLYFCWALACDLLVIALFAEKRWPWPWIGIVIGLGGLTKYAMLLFLPIMGGAMVIDPIGRRQLKSAWPWIATAIALVMMTPAIVWNQQHGWVSLRHVATQTGAAGGRLSHGNTLETIAGQIGAAGPTIAVLMAAGVILAYQRRDRRAMWLANIGLGFLAFNLIASFVAKVQQNWPAPAYFTLSILAAWFLSTLDTSGWRRWRGWLYGSVAIGLGTMIVARDPSIFFPLAKPFTKNVAAIDLLGRLRGWQQCGATVSADLSTLPSGSFVLCDDYQQTAEMAFYVTGQPTTYCAGPYLGARLSQYDMWPDHRLDKTSPLVGRDAIYLGKGGKMPDAMLAAFDSIEPLVDLDIIVRGVREKTFRRWRCTHFKGFDAIGSRPAPDAY